MPQENQASNQINRRLLSPEEVTVLVAHGLRFWASDRFSPNIAQLHALDHAGVHIDPATPAVLRLELPNGQKFVAVLVEVKADNAWAINSCSVHAVIENKI